MLSRRSALVIARSYPQVFVSDSAWHGLCFDPHMLHDFLFAREFPDWVYDKAQFLFNEREAQEWIMHLHSGASVVQAMPNATTEERQRIGQTILKKLAEEILNVINTSTNPKRFFSIFTNLVRSLELDGYKYVPPRLLAPESDVLDVREEQGVLTNLYTRIGLAEQEVVHHCLKLSEEHWLNGKWDDCIGNARKFLEAVLREVANAHSLKKSGAPVPPKDYAKAEMVRQYLRREGLLEQKEEKAICEVYGLLSNAGNHPYIAAQDQARLLRQLALVLAQFVMLRYQGYLAANP